MVRISAALDGSQKLPGTLRGKTRSSDELRGFEQEMAALDHALTATAPKAQPPASLHRSIMRAVEGADRPVEAPNRLALLRWLAVPALAAMALLVVWHALRGPVRPPAPQTQSLAAAASALELGDQLTQVTPSAVVAPLSGELERLKEDLKGTAQYLLASLP